MENEPKTPKPPVYEVIDRLNNKISALESDNQKIREALYSCIDFIHVLEEKRIVHSWSGLEKAEQALKK